MRKKYYNKRNIHFLLTGIIGFIGIMGLVLWNHTPYMNQIYAKEQTTTKNNTLYQYDALGRVIRVDYGDDTYVEFSYDKNGNITDVTKGKKPTQSNTEQGNDTTEIQGGNQSGGDAGKSESGTTDSTTTESGDNTGNNDSGGQSDKGSQNTLTTKDVKQYNLFKKKKPTIKSIKQSKKKNKRYITVQIKQVNKKGAYGEAGYQIKYATNSKFKKAKTVTVKRHKKKKFTTKKWKVSKKTYYVKVRAYLITKKGKKIYTKYSKVKKIKVK